MATSRIVTPSTHARSSVGPTLPIDAPKPTSSTRSTSTSPVQSYAVPSTLTVPRRDGLTAIESSSFEIAQSWIQIARPLGSMPSVLRSSGCSSALGMSVPLLGSRGETRSRARSVTTVTSRTSARTALSSVPRRRVDELEPLDEHVAVVRELHEPRARVAVRQQPGDVAVPPAHAVAVEAVAAARSAAREHDVDRPLMVRPLRYRPRTRAATRRGRSRRRARRRRGSSRSAAPTPRCRRRRGTSCSRARRARRPARGSRARG